MRQIIYHSNLEIINLSSSLFNFICSNFALQLVYITIDTVYYIRLSVGRFNLMSFLHGHKHMEALNVAHLMII